MSTATSGWQAFRHILSRNAAARWAVYVLLALYASALFAGFLAPYAYDHEVREHSWAPPSDIHFRDSDKHWQRPFVYAVSYTFDDNAQRIYVEDTTRRVPLRLFVNGRLFGLDSAEAAAPIPNGAPVRLYLLGADGSGRDLLSRLLYGGRISLSIGVLGVFLSTTIALLVGGLSGFLGGWVDNILMRICEIVMLIPAFYLLMLLRASLPLDWDSRVVYLSIVLILSFLGWAGQARVIRGMVLSIRQADHVMAARALGVAPWRILTRHVLPQTFGLLVVQATLAVPGYVVAESGLSLLGLGIQEPQTSWGNLLQEAMSIAEIRLHPWSLLPGLVLFVAVLTYNLAGDALRDALDPRGDE